MVVVSLLFGLVCLVYMLTDNSHSLLKKQKDVSRLTALTTTETQDDVLMTCHPFLVIADH